MSNLINSLLKDLTILPTTLITNCPSTNSQFSRNRLHHLSHESILISFKFRNQLLSLCINLTQIVINSLNRLSPNFGNI